MRIGPALTMSLLLVAPSAEPSEKHEHGGPADRQSSETAWAWFDVLYDVVRREAITPPAASRVYGVSAVALYEAVVPGARRHRSLAKQLSGLTSVPKPRNGRGLYWPAVADAAFSRTVRGLLPALKPESVAAIETLERDLHARFREEAGAEEVARSAAHGRAVADTILAWAASDGYATHNNCAYVPQAVDGAWEPTPPAFNPNPLQPCWGRIRPMVLGSGEACAPAGPPAFGEDDFHQAAMEVYATDLELTDEQKTIAAYWADGAGATGTPAGHWIAIVGQIARHDHLSLAAAAEAFARVGIAVNDAFIQCWHTKYAHNLQRPVTYIRDHLDANWLPHLATPAFPTYASGHSTQSGAAAEVLRGMFGRKAFRDTLHQDHQLTPAQPPRSFASFDAAAREAAVSRLYGGIHFSFDNEDGLAAGRCIGRRIQRRIRFKDEGPAGGR